MEHLVTPEQLLVLFLPKGTDISRYKILEAFVTSDASLSPYVGKADIILEEQNIIPPDIVSSGIQVESKGFYDPVKLYDFPLRDKLATLIVKRRRWINKNTGEYLHIPFAPKHPNAFSSEELIAFLK